MTLAFTAGTTVTTHAQTVLFQSQPDQHVYHRIPAIASHGNTLWAFGDDRSGVTDATAWGDIGSVGNIAFAYEDNGVQIRCGSQNMEVYDLTFRTFSLETITSGAYRYRK